MERKTRYLKQILSTSITSKTFAIYEVKTMNKTNSFTYIRGQLSKFVVTLEC